MLCFKLSAWCMGVFRDNCVAVAISTNYVSEHGQQTWEIKQYIVSSLERPSPVKLNISGEWAKTQDFVEFGRSSSFIIGIWLHVEIQLLGQYYYIRVLGHIGKWINLVLLNSIYMKDESFKLLLTVLISKALHGHGVRYQSARIVYCRTIYSDNVQ